MSIHVEIRIRGGLDELWRRTQDPGLHERWDLRFDLSVDERGGIRIRSGA